MSLDTTQTETDIINRLKAQVVPRVYDTQLPEGLSPSYPLIVVYFGDPVRAADDRHITGTRNDGQVAFGTVQVVSTDALSAKQIAGKVRNALVGYRPSNSGEMTLNGGMNYQSAGTATKPTLFYREVGFEWRTNLSWVD